MQQLPGRVKMSSAPPTLDEVKIEDVSSDMDRILKGDELVIKAIITKLVSSENHWDLEVSAVDGRHMNRKLLDAVEKGSRNVYSALAFISDDPKFLRYLAQTKKDIDQNPSQSVTTPFTEVITNALQKQESADRTTLKLFINDKFWEKKLSRGFAPLIPEIIKKLRSFFLTLSENEKNSDWKPPDSNNFLDMIKQCEPSTFGVVRSWLLLPGGGPEGILRKTISQSFELGELIDKLVKNQEQWKQPLEDAVSNAKIIDKYQTWDSFSVSRYDRLFQDKQDLNHRLDIACANMEELKSEEDSLYLRSVNNLKHTPHWNLHAKKSWNETQRKISSEEIYKLEEKCDAADFSLKDFKTLPRHFIRRHSI